ncbi:MAG: hypothetical protein QM696_06230 [Steroidobacteraceae bacterium]
MSKSSANPLAAVRFTHTHAYPGAHCTISPSSEGQILIEFSDASHAAGVLQQQTQDELRLEAGAYRTASGTEIDAKNWLLRRESGDRWRVVKRL